MNQRQLIEALAASAHLTRSDAEAVIQALFAVPDGILADALRHGERIRIAGFGSLSTARRPPRPFRNPTTGEPGVVPARTVVRFRPAPALVRMVAPVVDPEPPPAVDLPDLPPPPEVAVPEVPPPSVDPDETGAAGDDDAMMDIPSFLRPRGGGSDATPTPLPDTSGGAKGGDLFGDTRKAWPRVDAPDAEVVGRRFEVTVGLRRDRDVRVGGTGAMTLPSGRFRLDVELIVDGFVSLDGTHRFALDVGPDDPFPSRTVQLVALNDPELPETRDIGVAFWLDGRMAGYAHRRIRIVQTAGDLAVAEPPEIDPAPDGHVDLQPFDPEDQASLTILVSLSDRSDGKALVWSARSPRFTVAMPPRQPNRPDPLTTFLRSEPLAFLEGIARKGGRTADPYALFTELRGDGSRIAELIPPPIRTALADLMALPREQRSVLFVTQDPYIPWELAHLDLGLDPDEAAERPFMGAHLAVGRWPLHSSRPPPVPQRQISVDRTAVITAVYEGVAGAKRLEQAEEEAEDIVAEFGPAYSVAPRLRAVMDCLRGEPEPVDILHFALHGQFDAGGRTDGLILLAEASQDPDRTVPDFLTPNQVRGSALARPSFVFLNACQVGAGRSLLGDYAGMAPDFIAAGASAVVAPLWEIDDGDARQVALSFYRSTLAAGRDEAVSGAEFFRALRAGFTRTLARNRKASNVLLAYQFFGHPGYRIQRHP